MSPEEEKKYFDSFIKSEPRLHEGEIIDFNERSSWPDVVFKSKDDNLIAIELTELLLGENIEKRKVRQQDNLENQILSRSIEQLRNSNIPQKFFIDILIDHRNPLRNAKKAREIGDHISNFIIDEILKKEFNGFERIDYENSNLKEQKIDRVTIFYSNKITTITGNIGSSGVRVNKIDNNEITTIIDKKDTKIINDSGEYFQVWLVIIETEKAATWREQFEELNQQIFQTKHDKVFVHRYLYEKTFSLKLKKKKHNNGYRS